MLHIPEALAMLPKTKPAAKPRPAAKRKPDRMSRRALARLMSERPRGELGCQV